MKFRYERRSPDNSMMESFFGILKSEMFYGYENIFKSLKQLEQAIVDYIDYQNNKRIKEKPKGFSPVKYGTKSFGQPICLTFFGSVQSECQGFIVLYLTNDDDLFQDCS